MATLKPKKTKIEDTVVGAYQKIEDTVVGTYQKIEDAVVGTYQKIEDKFVDLTIEKLKEYDLLNPKRVMFISFSFHM